MRHLRGLRKDASAGVDGVTCEEKAKRTPREISGQLYQRLRDGKYFARPLRRDLYPEGGRGAADRFLYLPRRIRSGRSDASDLHF